MLPINLKFCNLQTGFNGVEWTVKVDVEIGEDKQRHAFPFLTDP